MKKMMMVLLLSLASCTLLLGTNEEKQLEKANNVVNEIMQTPDKGIPQDLLDKAVCVGIVPSELKFAIGIGGTYGRGVFGIASIDQHHIKAALIKNLEDRN